jgi:hypothetical protein
MTNNKERTMENKNCNICKHLKSCTIELSIDGENPDKFVCINFELKQSIIGSKEKNGK